MTDPAPQHPGAYGFLALLRRLEQTSGGKPRIGKNLRLKDEVAELGQDPSLAFPPSDFSDISTNARGTPRLRARFLGFFGPQGALPLNTTEEVARWVHGGDDAFVRFTDLFAARFLELFFRAWSDARAITQFDSPDQDRFRRHVAAVAGIGTRAFTDRDGVDDIVKTPLVHLAGARVKSPVRLRQMIEHHLGATVEVEEHVPAWMRFEPEDCNRLGQRGATLGRDAYLGAGQQSVGERLTLHIRTQSLAEYRSYLPGGAAHAQLGDLVAWYLGKSFEVGVQLSLPASEMPQAALGSSTELGWMASLAPPPAANRAAAPVKAAAYLLGADSDRAA